MKYFEVKSWNVPRWGFAWMALCPVADSVGRTWYAFTPNPYLSEKWFDTQHEAEDYVMAMSVLSLPLNRRINGKEPQFEL